jgi:hypothetical protein
MKNTKQLLEANKYAGGEKQKTSFYVNVKLYDKFKRLCEKRGVKPSRAVEAMMADAIDLYG